MRRFALVLAAAWIATAPVRAQAPATVALTPGDAAAIRIGDDGAISSSAQPGAADWTPMDLMAARRLSGEPIPDRPVPYAVVIHGDKLNPPPPEPGLLRVKLLSIAGRHSLLVLENGYDHAIVYRARMTHDGQTRPTDVCLVIPNQRGYEHWPHVIDRLEIYDVHLVEWRQGDPVPCV